MDRFFRACCLRVVVLAICSFQSAASLVHLQLFERLLLNPVQVRNDLGRYHLQRRLSLSSPQDYSIDNPVANHSPLLRADLSLQQPLDVACHLRLQTVVVMNS